MPPASYIAMIYDQQDKAIISGLPLDDLASARGTSYTLRCKLRNLVKRDNSPYIAVTEAFCSLIQSGPLSEPTFRSHRLLVLLQHRISPVVQTPSEIGMRILVCGYYSRATINSLALLVYAPLLLRVLTRQRKHVQSPNIISPMPGVQRGRHSLRERL